MDELPKIPDEYQIVATGSKHATWQYKLSVIANLEIILGEYVEGRHSHSKDRLAAANRILEEVLDCQVESDMVAVGNVIESIGKEINDETVKMTGRDGKVSLLYQVFQHARQTFPRHVASTQHINTIKQLKQQVDTLIDEKKELEERLASRIKTIKSKNQGRELKLQQQIDGLKTQIAANEQDLSKKARVIGYLQNALANPDRISAMGTLGIQILAERKELRVLRKEKVHYQQDLKSVNDRAINAESALKSYQESLLALVKKWLGEGKLFRLLSMAFKKSIAKAASETADLINQNYGMDEKPTVKPKSTAKIMAEQRAKDLGAGPKAKAKKPETKAEIAAKKTEIKTRKGTNAIATRRSVRPTK